MSKDEIFSEVEEHKRELVLDCVGELVKLIGVIEDPDDYYYEMLYMGRGTILVSCVGGFIILKGKIDDEDYNRLKNMFELNVNFKGSINKMKGN